jgi:hypothetical protein
MQSKQSWIQCRQSVVVLDRGAAEAVGDIVEVVVDVIEAVEDVVRGVVDVVEAVSSVVKEAVW